MYEKGQLCRDLILAFSAYSLSFVAVVIELLDFEARRVVGPAFRVNLAVGNDILETGQILPVICNNELDTWRRRSC